MNRLVTIIPVYNGERFLKATLGSVLGQTRRPDRVIIQDNCSTDSTKQIAEDFAKEGFEWMLNDKHVPAAENFNLALRYAEEADVLHLLPADDIIKPHFYEAMLEPLKSIEGRTLVYAAYEVIDEDGQLMTEGDLVNPFPIIPDGKPRRIPHKEFIASQAKLRTVCLPSVVLKTNHKALPVKLRTNYIQCADVVFYAELAKRCEHLIEVPSALCQYRRHENAATSRNKTYPSALIADEWQAMEAASGFLEKNGISAWLWNFRQRCLLAGSSRVLLCGVGKVTPQYHEEVVCSTREITGNIAWYLGSLAFALRDFLRHGRL